MNPRIGRERATVSIPHLEVDLVVATGETQAQSDQLQVSPGFEHLFELVVFVG